MIKLKISSKLLVYFFIVSLIPLLVVDIVLVSSAKSQLLKATTSNQKVVAASTADSVDNYLSNKISVLSFQAQEFALGDFQNSVVSQNIKVLLSQDEDLSYVVLLDENGSQISGFSNDDNQLKVGKQSVNDAFKTVKFFYGKEYVSSVSYNDRSEPIITIGVPIIKQGTSSAPKKVFTGAILANYNISDLWQTVLSTKVGRGGYAYVVDSLGNLVAHPNKNFLSKNQKISNVEAVTQFIKSDNRTIKTISETGQKVISTPRKLTYSNWAVIVQEPVSSIYSDINSFIRLSVYIFLSAVALSILMGLLFRKQILEPVKKLSFGAKRLGGGEFDSKIDINSNDELKDLADTFNSMASNIKKLVSDLKSNNLNLLSEHSKLSSIIQSVSDGIIAINHRHQIVSINPPAAHLIDSSPDKVAYRSLTEIYNWKHNDKPLVLELDKPGIYLYDNVILPHGNDASFVNLVVVVLAEKTSDITAIITVHNFTESRELEVMKLDFVAIAAHELRTPLTFMRGYLELMQNEDSKMLTPAGAERLRRAMIGVEQLANLINNLLNVSRVERGVMQIALAKVELTALVKQTIEAQQETAKVKKQIITYAGNNSQLIAPADPSAIGEVLSNLISNAIKYSPEGSKIVVRSYHKDEYAYIEIQDKGPGIPKEALKHLFTKFYRVEHSLITGNRGTGLGLYISKAIVNLHKGKIGWRENTNGGSIFYFTLPLYDEAKHGKLIILSNKATGIHGWISKNISR